MKRLPPRLPQFASFALFIALCMSLAYWALQVSKPPARAVVAPGPITAPQVAIDAAAALFGGSSVVAAASNYQLKGIVADNQGRRSAAILSVDGKPAVALGVGGVLAPGVTVQEIFARYILLREGGAQKRLDLPDASQGQNGAANSGGNLGGNLGSNPGGNAPNPTPTPSAPLPAQLPPQIGVPQSAVVAPSQPAFAPAAPMSLPPGPVVLPRAGTTTVTPTPPGH